MHFGMWVSNQELMPGKFTSVSKWNEEAGILMRPGQMNKNYAPDI